MTYKNLLYKKKKERRIDKEDVVCMYVCMCMYIYIHIHTYIHTHCGISLSLKKNEIIMPSEISHMEKDKYYMISLICGI